MIEVRRLPGSGVVAGIAGLREARRDVVGTRSRLEIRHVATGALGRCALEYVIDVALRALHRDVRSGQSEFCSRVVVERCAQPVDRGVAQRAVGREPRGHVVRIRRRVERSQVASRAGR